MGCCSTPSTVSQLPTAASEHLITVSRLPTVPQDPWAAQLTSVKCGSLLGLFCRKLLPSTQLCLGSSALWAQARAGNSALYPCPVLSPQSQHRISLLLTYGCLWWAYPVGVTPPNVCHWAPTPPSLSAEVTP
jgi:hypothetical protein